MDRRMPNLTSSKFLVSSSLDISWTMGGTLWRMLAKLHCSFLKNGCRFTDSAPSKPRRDVLHGKHRHYMNDTKLDLGFVSSPKV